MPQYKELSRLRDLPRSPALSYLRKQTRRKAPRRAFKLRPSDAKLYAKISALTAWHFWSFIIHYVRHRLGRRQPFQTYRTRQSDNGIHQMPMDDTIRIALASDWGTGTLEARKIADLIERFRPHYSIHLGDVYYVGDATEVSENFLGEKNPAHHYEPCRWPLGSRGAFALNGNHEMYSLGTAYFTKMLPALGPMRHGEPQGQAASFFCLENKYWRLIALDTAYNSVGLPLVEYFWPPDCDLPAEVMDWLRDTVRPTRDDPRGIVLLSHHQYFSRFDRWYPKPARQLAEFFSRPVLWFWGHEHRMAIYREFGVEGGITAHGRCIGHGGMPVERPSKVRRPECVADFVDERPYPNGESLHIGFNGFARLSLQQDRMSVEYLDVLGHVIYSEVWTAKNGTLKRVTAGPAPLHRLKF